MPKARVNIMLDPDVIADVRVLAERERRSFSAQVQFMLEEQLRLSFAVRVHAPNAPGPGPEQR